MLKYNKWNNIKFDVSINNIVNTVECTINKIITQIKIGKLGGYVSCRIKCYFNNQLLFLIYPTCRDYISIIDNKCYPINKEFYFYFRDNITRNARMSRKLYINNFKNGEILKELLINYIMEYNLKCIICGKEHYLTFKSVFINDFHICCGQSLCIK